MVDPDQDLDRIIGPSGEFPKQSATPVLGDYNTLVSDNSGAWFIATDSRRGAACDDVDAYQAFLTANGFVIRSDGADRFSQKQTGINPALTDPSVKPAPPLVCPPNFGDTDAVVARFTP